MSRVKSSSPKVDVSRLSSTTSQGQVGGSQDTAAALKSDGAPSITEHDAFSERPLVPAGTLGSSAPALATTASGVGATTARVNNEADLRTLASGQNVKVSFVPEECGGDQPHDFDKMPFAARLFEAERPRLLSTMKKVTDDVNALLKETGFAIPDAVDIELYSLHNRQAAAYMRYGVMANLSFEDFLDFTKDLSPAEFADLRAEQQTALEDEFREVKEGEKIKLPICFSREGAPDALLDLILKDGLTSRDEFVLDGYEWVPNDRLDEAKCRDVDTQEALGALRPADTDKSAVYFDDGIYKSIAAHEYGHIVLNSSIVYSTMKGLQYSELLDSKAAELGESKYEPYFAELMKSFHEDAEITQLLDQARAIADDFGVDSANYGEAEAQELEAIRTKLRDNPLVKRIREETYRNPMIGDLLFPYYEFFADFLSVMFDSIAGEVPLGETGIAAYEAATGGGRPNYRSFNDSNAVTSLDQCHLATGGARVDQRDPHDLISYPRLFLKPFIERATTMEQKQQLVARVADTIREVFAGRIANDVIGIDFDFMYGMFVLEHDDPTLVYDKKPVRDVNSELLESLRANLSDLDLD